MNDTPIFWSLVKEMRREGHNLPWYQSFKPGGSIRFLSPTTTGIEWAPARSYLRDYLIQERYGMMVCNGKDNCPVCGLFYVNPT